MNKLLVILGPTATGKTDLALSLAKQINGELVSCDSRQVYKDLDIGTGKLPGKEVEVKKGEGFWEMEGIKVWMYDVADPRIRYTVKDYIEQANKVVKDIFKRKKTPIVVGGTGLYLKAFLEGLPNLSIPIDLKLRGELEKLSLEEQQQILQLLSPIRWKKLNNSDRKNSRRLLRSIELILMNPYKRTIPSSKLKVQKFKTLKIGLTAPRQLLNEKIDHRIFKWFEQGLIQEVENLLKDGISIERLKEVGLEYSVTCDFVSGKIRWEQFVEQLKNKNHQYAKRQNTWFKKEKDVLWFDITKDDFAQEVEKMIKEWYYQNNG